MSRASVAGRIGAFWRGKTNKLVIGIEIALSLFIVLSMGVTLLHQVDHGKQNNVFLRDFRFAEHKAFEILEELRIRVANRTGVDAQSLERFDDHEKLVHVLSVAKDKVGADPALTGNVKEGESWLWARSISVEELASRRVPELRTVTVKLFCKRGGGEYRQLVEVSETMGTAASSEPAQQVFDLYMIAIENVPGLWRPLSTIRPFIENRIKELETRNPGLELRAHWITKQSYGRDPTYAPQFSSTRVNSTSGTGRADETSGVYFYPNALYGAARVGAVLSLDGIAKNHGSAVENPHPYTLADQYNHAMRLPQERELFDARVRSGQEKPREPTLRSERSGETE